MSRHQEGVEAEIFLLFVAFDHLVVLFGMTQYSVWKLA
jgi:hypothetical protein